MFEHIHFDSDYMAGAHPEVLEAIVRSNDVQTAGYGADEYCRRAKARIRQACAAPEAEVFFFMGGTQANAVMLEGLLRPTEGVIAAATAHINVHEAGAIEQTGHKVIALPSHDGKLSASDVGDYLRDFYADDTWPHMVAPGAVYISFPTELGTIYTLDELTALSSLCRAYDIPLYIDGARLGYGLAASPDVTLADIARLADAFYIGGTKMGALFGEAAVCPQPQRLRHFFTLMKSRGSVLAKGRLLGVQFEQLFTDDLYLRIGAHGVAMAHELRNIFTDRGFSTYIDSPTNQQFFVLPNDVIDTLSHRISFELWGTRGDEHTPVRFVTSWETTSHHLELLQSYFCCI